MVRVETMVTKRERKEDTGSQEKRRMKIKRLLIRVKSMSLKMRKKRLKDLLEMVCHHLRIESKTSTGT